MSKVKNPTTLKNGLPFGNYTKRHIKSKTITSLWPSLSIENDEAKSIDKVDIIRKFASVNVNRQANFGLLA